VRTHAPPRDESLRFERIPTEVFADAETACRALAARIAGEIRHRAAEGRPYVLGLATGSTPLPLYRELIRLHRREDLSFANVVAFNLDEYYGLSRSHPESYWVFMREQLFAHLDIPEDHIHLPEGTVPRSEVYGHCAGYETAIEAAGGIDLQILGIGRSGHIGFNEPGSRPDSRTRLVTLDPVTRRDAARDFVGEENVPRHALTMGVATILDARQVVLLAWGRAKAEAVARAVEGEESDALPASFLQSHPNAAILLDPAAASELTRVRHPWRVGPVEWTPAMTGKAVAWLSSRVSKPILKLIEDDYRENSISELITERGSAYQLNIEAFNRFQHTITGWPGGKPGAGESHRPERAAPHPKRALALSPEPRDDTIGMGGTLHRLVDQGHEVTLVYLTSGDLAVPDGDALRLSRIFAELDLEQDSAPPNEKLIARVHEELGRKGPFDPDSPELRYLKGLIRREEARAASQQCGVHPSSTVFLDLPFYQNGRYRSFAPGPDDLAKVVRLLRDVRPHQVYATGYLQDPSSVPGICFDLLSQALEACRDEPWFADCRIWLYRGAEAEWEIHDIDMAVPLSPSELQNKVQGIYQHQSQRGQTPFHAESGEEIWQQAAERNKHTAALYDALGLPEYEAIEAFHRYQP